MGWTGLLGFARLAGLQKFSRKTNIILVADIMMKGFDNRKLYGKEKKYPGSLFFSPCLCGLPGGLLEI